jgi:hypothetical protein
LRGFGIPELGDSAKLEFFPIFWLPPVAAEYIVGAAPNTRPVLGTHIMDLRKTS